VERGKDWKSTRSANTTGIQKIFCFLQKIFCKPAFFLLTTEDFFAGRVWRRMPELWKAWRRERGGRPNA
jgi:hypothetical protein